MAEFDDAGVVQFLNDEMLAIFVALILVHFFDGNFFASVVVDCLTYRLTAY